MDTLPDIARRTLLTLLVIGALLLGAATIAGLTGGGLFHDQLQGALTILAAGPMVGGMVGLALVVAGRAPRIGTVLLVVSLLAGVSMAGFGLDHVSGATYGTRLTHATDEATGATALLALGLAFPLGLAGLGIALWRTGAVPAVAGITLAIGALAFPLGRVPEVAALTIVSDLLLVAGTVLVVARLRGATSPSSALATPA